MNIDGKKQILMAVAIVGASLLVASCSGSQVVTAKDGSQAKPTGLAALFSSSHPVTVPQGTILRIRTMNAVSTHDTKSGQMLQATLDAPLIVDGVVIAPRGADATLLVADSDPGGRVKGVARIGLRLTSVRMLGENKAVMTNTAWHEARATKKKDAAKIGVMSGIGAAIGALAGGGKGAAIGAGAGAGAGTAVVLSTHGDAAVVPAESVLQFRLEQAFAVVVRG